MKGEKKILQHSPTAIRFLKNSFIAESDGLAGLQNLAGDITMMYYMTEEAKEGKNAFLEKRMAFPLCWSPKFAATFKIFF